MPFLSPGRISRRNQIGARSVEAIQKRAGKSRREKPDAGQGHSGPGYHIRYCEEDNDCERADQQHVAHVVTRDARARFGRAFYDTIVFHVRHRSLRRQQRLCNNAARLRLFRSRFNQLRGQMWSVPNVYTGSVTLSRLFS